MEKLSGIASALAIVLAVIAGFVAIPSVDATLVILILGIIGGIAASQDGAVRMYLAVLVLPAVGAALSSVPAIGEYLNTIFGNLTAAAAGMSASLIVRRLIEMVMGAVNGLTAGGDSDG